MSPHAEEPRPHGAAACQGVVNLHSYKLQDQPQLNLIPGPDLLTLIFGPPVWKKFVVDIQTFSRHSSYFRAGTHISTTGPKHVERYSDVSGDEVEHWAWLIEAIYDPILLVKTLPQTLKTIGLQEAQGGPIDLEGAIPLTQNLLKLATKYNFHLIIPAIKETLVQLVGSPAALSRLLHRIELSIDPARSYAGVVVLPDAHHAQLCRKSLAEWKKFVEQLLHLAHKHHIPAMFPGLYFLILSLYGPAQLSVDPACTLSDRARCLAGFPFIHRDICKYDHIFKQEKLDHRALWAFYLLRSDVQEQIWNGLPVVFKFKGWEELERGVIDTTAL